MCICHILLINTVLAVLTTCSVTKHGENGSKFAFDLISARRRATKREKKMRDWNLCHKWAQKWKVDCPAFSVLAFWVAPTVSTRRQPICNQHQSIYTAFISELRLRSYEPSYNVQITHSQTLGLILMVIFIHTIMCRDRQTDRPDEKQYSQYSSQKARSRKTSQTDAIKYPRDCPHTIHWT